MPPACERTFGAALIAEATNLGLSRMAEVCGVASRRALIRMQTWHMRTETFRAALACLTDAIHAEPMSAWFGAATRASADGQHFHLGGPGEGRGQVNAHYGRDPIVKIYTTITGRYAPQVIAALRARTVVPSLLLKKLSAFRQQNSLAAALREVGRVRRTLFTLRWIGEPTLRRLVNAELNKGEARNSLARAIAFHRLGRFRDRDHENQQLRAGALNLVTACVVLFNCRYLDRAVAALQARGVAVDAALLPHLSPLGWDHINLTGDYIWSDTLPIDAEGYMPLKLVV